jgi:hypothetical protein
MNPPHGIIYSRKGVVKMAKGQNRLGFKELNEDRKKTNKRFIELTLEETPIAERSRGKKKGERKKK